LLSLLQEGLRYKIIGKVMDILDEFRYKSDDLCNHLKCLLKDEQHLVAILSLTSVLTQVVIDASNKLGIGDCEEFKTEFFTQLRSHFDSCLKGEL
jgi:hypothetical protein